MVLAHRSLPNWRIRSERADACSSSRPPAAGKSNSTSLRSIDAGCNYLGSIRPSSIWHRLRGFTGSSARSLNRECLRLRRSRHAFRSRPHEKPTNASPAVRSEKWCSFQARRRKRKRSPPRQWRAGPDRTRRHRVERRRRCNVASLRKPHDQTAAFGFPAERRPQRSKNRSDGDVRTIELLRKGFFQGNAHAPRPALDDQRVAFVPDAVGQSRQQWGDRCKNTSTRHIRAYVACERAAIDQNRYRSRWE